MIQHEFLPDRRILVVRPVDRLSEADFLALAEEVDPLFDAPEGVRGLLIEAPAFPGWDSFAGFLAHMRFVKEHQRQLKRVAVVTDIAMAAALPPIAQLFLSAQIQHFAADQRDEALAWIDAAP